MSKWPGFIGGSDVAPTLIGSGAETVNLYVERLPQGGANQAALLPLPGLQPWSRPPVSGLPPAGGTRALAAIGMASPVWGGTIRLFAVIGDGFWEFDVNGMPTRRGTVAHDTQPAQIAQNGVLRNEAGAARANQLAIASGGTIYSYDLATNVLAATSLTGGYTHVAFCGGFGLAFNGTTGKVNLSALLDFTVWDAGQFFRRSLFADPWRAMFVDQNNLVWMLGTDSFETWYSTGQGTQPFAPLSGLVGALGIVGPWAFTMAQVGNVWLARNQGGQGLLVTTRGSAPEAISSPAMAAAVADYSRTGGLAQTELVHHQTAAHLFTNLTVPDQGTWTYDHLEQTWTRRGVWQPATGTFGIWAPRVHVMAYGKHLVGDRDSGTLWEMDGAVATEMDGTGIRRLRRAPALVSEKKRAPIDQIELLLDVGLGLQAGQGAPPEILLRVSDDGGRTWSNQLRASTGAAGAWRTRVYWTRLGLSNDAVAEVTYTDPVPLRLVDAFLNNAEAA